jgi:glycosyltransferase involved in cell wall biosynthesis
VTHSRLTVLQISTYEHRGGAERVAHDLFEAYRSLGHRSYLVAGRGPSGDPDVVTLEHRHGPAHILSGAGRLLDRWRGIETYRYPASRGIVRLFPHEPDIIHAHNMHGGYFDLRVLPALSRRIPTVLTLHDAWLLSGHCAHSFDCERWRTGCGECPDLSIYPAIRRDATAANWRRKRDIFGRSTLHIVTPSAWLMERVRASMLAPAARTMHVIPNGVDLEVFAPGDRAQARERLGLRREGHVVLVAGSELRTNHFKDWPTARAAAEHAASTLDAAITLVALGDRGEPEESGDVKVLPVPFEHDPATVADWYRAADVHLHTAHADTFPGTVIESLACGTPVVATAVGGIPEQVKSLDAVDGAGEDAATGVLVAQADAGAAGRALAILLERPELRDRLGANAAADARRRFDFATQRDAYLSLYHEMMESSEPAHSPS